MLLCIAGTFHASPKNEVVGIAGYISSVRLRLLGLVVDSSSYDYLTYALVPKTTHFIIFSLKFCNQSASFSSKIPKFSRTPSARATLLIANTFGKTNFSLLAHTSFSASFLASKKYAKNSSPIVTRPKKVEVAPLILAAMVFKNI